MKLFGGSSNGKHAQRGSSRAQNTPKRAKRSRGRTALLVIVTILALGVVSYVLLDTFFINPPDISPPPDMSGSTRPDVSGAPLPSGASPSSSSPAPQLQWKDGVYTVLMVGTYEDGNTDTIMFCTLDTNKHTLNVMSIPRDTAVDTDTRKLKKINGAYATGGSGEKGMEALCQEVSTILGFVPHRYAMVQMKGFKELVNAIGGVQFDVPMNMYWYDGKTTIDLKKGDQLLNGDKALQLMRYRHYGSNNKAGVDHDDYGRMEMQQRFLKQVAKQTLSIKQVFKIPQFVDIASSNIKPTNISAGEMTWFATELLKLDTDSISFCTLPTETSAANYYENIKQDEALVLINDTINPYTTDVTKSMVRWVKH